MPTDDPAPRTRLRRETADAEAGRAPAAAAAANGSSPAAASDSAAPSAPDVSTNGEQPVPSPRPAPRPDLEDASLLDDLFGSDPRIDDFFNPPVETPSGRTKQARRGRRKIGAVAAVAAPQSSLVGPVVGPVVAEPLTATETVLGPSAGYRARRAARRQRARRVHRLVRHVEPWSVLKLALVFYFCLWVIMLVSGAILWRVAVSSGVIDNIEGFINDILVLDNFTFNGDELFRAYAVGGLLMVLVATGFTVLATVLFNLISDLIGGVRVTVIQEETARPNQPPPGSG